MPITQGYDNNDTTITDANGNIIGVAGSPLTVAGAVTITQTFSTIPTYSVAGTFTAANSATDILTLTGSATKTVRILDFWVSITATSGSNATILGIKRSAANTGGTSTTPNKVPFDSLNAAATATARVYTANPTALGTNVGNLLAISTYVSGGGTIGSTPFRWEQNETVAQAITLRGTSELFAINLNGVTLSGNVVRYYIVWSEE